MLMKIIGKYVLMPGAGVAMLAGFGMFDLGGTSATSPGRSAGLGSMEDASGSIMSALEGPLSVAARIATAGSSAIGMDPNSLPAFLREAKAPASSYQVPAGGAGGASAVISAATGGGAPAGGASGGFGTSQTSSSGFASARPPATATD